MDGTTKDQGVQYGSVMPPMKEYPAELLCSARCMTPRYPPERESIYRELLGVQPRVFSRDRLDNNGKPKIYADLD